MTENISNNPKVSVIVPVYKAEKYLHRCIDSLVNQTLKDIEIILVDDGSPDNSGIICDEYASRDSRIKVIHKENGGVSSARNVGIENAKGKWISFCDADDWIELSYLDEALYLTNENIDIVKSGFIIRSENSENERLPLNFSYEEQVSLIHLGCHFIRLSFLMKNNIRFPDGITLAEDCYFNYLLLLFSPNVKYLNKVTYNYFQNDESVMHTLSKKNIKDEIKIIKYAENQQIKNDVVIYLLKHDVKNKIIHVMSDLTLFRKTFPECDKEQFRRANIKGKIFLLLIKLHFDCFVKFLLKRNVKKSTIIIKENIYEISDNR